MVVIAIIAATMLLAIPKLFRSTATNLREVARNYTVLGKEIRNRARVSHSTMRLVIDLDPANPRYWVEKANGPQLIDPKYNAEEAARKEEEDKAKENPPPPAWEKDTSVFKGEKKLPGRLTFLSVETAQAEAPQTEGLAFIYFFPEGLVQAAAVQITDKSANVVWTIMFNPLTGQADIAEEARSLKDVNK